MRFDTLDAWLAWQETLNPAEIALGLERVREVLQRMGLMRPDFAVITIAGTNGKGSSGAMLQSIYSAAGYQVGLYSSPHLVRYNERITLNGTEVDDATLCDAFEQVEAARCAEDDEVPLTYFEFGTLAAIVIFQQAGAVLAVLEVGLGGRLDAVNALEPDVALVTMVDVDHQAWLGSGREAIAREKAGIYRRGVPAICGEAAPATSLVDYASDIGADFYALNQQFSYHQNSDATWNWRCAEHAFERLPLPGMSGSFQLQNAAGVLMAIGLLQRRFPLERDAIERGLCQARLAGRLQRVPVAGYSLPECLLDVAHNPSSARVLAEMLRSTSCEGETRAVIAMLADKDIAAVIAEMEGVVDRWYVASLDESLCHRGASAAAVASHLSQQTALFDDIAAALAAALVQSSTGDRLIIFGSFYTVAEAKSFLDERAELG